MARSRPPSFDFYADDFMAGTVHLPPAAIGCYIRLLCFQWSHGSIPSDDRQLARIAGVYTSEEKQMLADCLAKFVRTSDGNLQNERLERERQKKMSALLRRAQANSKGLTKIAEPKEVQMNECDGITELDSTLANRKLDGRPKATKQKKRRITTSTNESDDCRGPSEFQKARQTEYKGIIYRSRSEAMFARYLELRLEEDEFMHGHKGPFFIGGFGEKRGGFTYEPQLHRDWKPDFLFWQVSCESAIPWIDIEIIEYKPSRPTQTYCDEFAHRAAHFLTAHVENDCNADELRSASYAIYYGSKWETDRGRIVFYPAGGQWEQRDIVEDWLEDFENAVTATRFDLVRQP